MFIKKAIKVDNEKSMRDYCSKVFYCVQNSIKQSRAYKCQERFIIGKLLFAAHSDDDIEVTSAFKIARNSSSDFSHHHHPGLLKPSCLSTFGPPVPPTPPYSMAPPPGLGGPGGGGHEFSGFNPLLLNAQLALQAMQGAMAAAMASTTSSTTPVASLFNSTPATTTPGGHHEAGTLHSMEKMVAGINGTNE